MHRTQTPKDHFESINVFVKDNLWKESKIHFGDPCQPPSPHFPSSFTWRLPQFFPTSLSARFIIIALAVRALMELLTEHNPIFCPNPELKTLIIYYYKETITTGSVHTMHNNVDNEENFLLGNAVQRKAERASTNAV